MYDLQGAMREMFEAFYQKLLGFLPNLLVALIILLVGVTLAKLLGFIFLRIFRAMNVDRFWDRAGIREVLIRGGIKRPLSTELARIISWLTILVFVVIALNSLEIPVVVTVLSRFFLYVPNIFVALLILFAGYLLSNFFARAALIALVNSGVHEAGMVARAVRLAIFVFAGTMALEQLNIGRVSVLIAFGIMFGGVVLGFAIAFGLGAQHYVRDYLQRRIEGGEDNEGQRKDGIDHI